MTHHRLLLRQLKNLIKGSSFSDTEDFFKSLAEKQGDANKLALEILDSLLNRVTDSYTQFDRDLELRTRSLEISSSELNNLNNQLLREREKTKDTLVETELRFQLALEATNLGLWDWNLSLNTVYFSPEWYRLLGYDDQELPMNFATWDLLLHQEDKESAYKSLNSHLASTSEEFDVEIRMKCKNGKWKWIRSRGKVIDRNELNEARRMVGTHIDITMRKQIEKDLSTAKEAAEFSSRLKSEFLANMSHEIRTPLNAIIGMSDIALASELESSTKLMIETISISAKDLSAIINDILDFSKIEAGKLMIEDIDIKLEHFLDETTKIFSSRIKEKGLSLELHVNKDVPPWLITDPLRLRQILNNLLSNAIKFTNAGKIELAVSLVEKIKSDTVVQFSVKDSGIGISPDKQALLFNTFTQADSSITRRFGGTGLGLAISRRLAELLGGKIWIESEEGQGSTFHFTIHSKAVAFEKHLEYQERFEKGLLAPNSRPLKILLVEDIQVNQVMMKMLLKKVGHSVTLAENGKIATEIFFKEKWDVVLMDIQMPVMDGIAATKFIRSKEEGVKTPIIALTANAMSDDAAKCISAGMDAYLSKPINIEQLISTIEKLGL